MLSENIPNIELYLKSLDYDESLRQMIRDSIISELDAISLYDVQIASISNSKIRKILKDIRDEEVAHIGELYSILLIIDPEVNDNLKSGVMEVINSLK